MTIAPMARSGMRSRCHVELSARNLVQLLAGERRLWPRRDEHRNLRYRWYRGRGSERVNVRAFPAAGDHANYPSPNTDPLEENPYDGLSPWGNNLVASDLIPLPATAGQNNAWTSGPLNWTDWPGAWGDTPETGTLTFDGSPCGPAAPPTAADNDCGNDHAGHYYAPWSQTGTNLYCSGADCPGLGVRRPQRWRHAPAGSAAASQ